MAYQYIYTVASKIVIVHNVCNLRLCLFPKLMKSINSFSENMQ